MTREEFVAKYGDVKVKFSSYYKFTFTFNGITDDGYILSCQVGGNSDDIYRYSVSADTEETVVSLEPYSARVWDGETIINEFYDY